MNTSYVPYQPDQPYLLPCSLQEWLPPGHLAYFISDTVDHLDLSAFHARYAGGGSRNQPFHPAMMVKVLVSGLRQLRAQVVDFIGLGVKTCPYKRLICWV
jgi:transposase